ncbi:MAG: acetyl-CoA decarbonylase/synthase complex subunit delta [Candidatus Omnitrophota bacterium]|nr:acetyl-CoA decarbonylase/synthase complex subunit delta [Candidatus Omnitrophota bacterium]
MPIELLKEKYSGAINVVSVGTGPKAIKIGGETSLPFLFEEGDTPNAPVIAFEILDCEPSDWPDQLKEPFGDSVKDPAAWAKKCVEDFGARALCVRLQSVHPDCGNVSPDKAVSVLKSIASAVKVPLIVVGCGDDELDNDLLPKASQAMKGENVLLGAATQNNYKTLAATTLADGHSIIAESPIDINIAKQVNILISDMGLDPSKIVMHPTTTSLGYGMEYVYSIMERARLAAFIGDKMLSMPFILFVGQETWRIKEAKESGLRQGVNWEAATAVSMIQAGADLIVLRHPEAAKAVGKYIDVLMKK